MSKGFTAFVSVIVTLLVIAIIFFGFVPAGRRVLLGYDFAMQKAGEVSYQNRKDVEDTCRSMIASYKADVNIYNLYKYSENTNQKNYADSALIRAINTATQYNEYVLKNSFVWSDNVPADIYMSLSTDIK